MYVEKMFSVPIGAGYDGFPFIATQAEKEMAEAFTVKAMAEREAFALKAKVKKPKAEESSFVVKAGCGSKRKAGEDREGDAAFTVKAKAEEEAACAVKAKAEEEAAFAVKAKSEDEEAAFTVKAKSEDEEAAFTVKAKSEEEEAAFTVQAKSEEEVASFTVQAEEEVEDSDDDCDSDEVADVDYEEFMARLIADYNAHADKLRADHPGMKYTDYSTEEYAYMRQSEEVEDSDAEVEDSDADEKFRAEYGDLFHKLKKEGSHGVDGLAPV